MRIDVRSSFSSFSPFDVVEYDIPYSNLVWNRRYYDYGEFQMEIDPALYDPDSWAFITSPDSGEIGIIQKLEYTSDNDRLLLSGLFAESVLDNAVQFYYNLGKYADSITGLCYDLFDTFYLPSTVALQFPISKAAQTRISWEDIIIPGSTSYPIPQGDGLGKLIFSFLDNEQASFSVTAKPDYSGGLFKIWSGKDRSISQSDLVPVVFDSSYGDIYDISIVRDVSGVKNRAIVDSATQAGGHKYVYVDSTDPKIPAVAGYYKEVLVISESPNNEASDTERENLARNSGSQALYDAKPVMDVNATLFDTSGLRKDFDLGDVITLQIPEVGITEDTRIVETTEIFNKDGRTVELGFGNKRISVMERAIKTWLYL